MPVLLSIVLLCSGASYHRVEKALGEKNEGESGIGFGGLAVCRKPSVIAAGEHRGMPR